MDLIDTFDARVESGARLEKIFIILLLSKFYEDLRRTHAHMVHKIRSAHFELCPHLVL